MGDYGWGGTYEYRWWWQILLRGWGCGIAFEIGGRFRNGGWGAIPFTNYAYRFDKMFSINSYSIILLLWLHPVCNAKSFFIKGMISIR